MAGLIEIQQALSHGTLAEKVQQSQEGNLTQYQQYTAAEMKQKDVQKQREANKADKTDDTRIRDRRKRQRKETRNRAGEEQLEDGTSADSSEQQDHILDIIA